MAKLKINRGTTYSITATYQKNGVVTPLTGCTVFFTMKNTEWDDSTGDATALISKTLTNLNDANAANGIAVITLTPTDTMVAVNSSIIDPGTYYYDIKVKENATTIYKIDEGTVLLDGSPTNRTS